MKHILAVAALAAALAVPAHAAGGITLHATVGPGFTITLTEGAKKVVKLKAGTYTIVVADKSRIHDFHLKGPGVNKTTTVAGTGTTTWKVRLKKGTYSYLCDPHKSFMHGSFRVV